MGSSRPWAKASHFVPKDEDQLQQIVVHVAAAVAAVDIDVAAVDGRNDVVAVFVVVVLAVTLVYLVSSVQMNSDGW